MMLEFKKQKKKKPQKNNKQTKQKKPLKIESLFFWNVKYNCDKKTLQKI